MFGEILIQNFQGACLSVLPAHPDSESVELEARTESNITSSSALMVSSSFWFIKDASEDVFLLLMLLEFVMIGLAEFMSAYLLPGILSTLTQVKTFPPAHSSSHYLHC